jgi:hypothetical protein
MKRIRRIAFVLTAVLVPCAGHAGPKPFDVPEKDFFSRVHHVAIAPCRFPASFERSDTLMALEDSVAMRIDSLLVAALQANGLEVVSGRETRAIYDRMVDSLGGLFDPATGVQDSARFELAESRTREAVRAVHPVDTWIYPRVFQTGASFRGGKAAWHGVTQKVTPESFGKGLFKSLTMRTSDVEYNGTIPALSLYVPFVAEDGTSLYSWSGGLHVTAIFSGGKFTDLPSSQYFAEPERIARAVEESLEPWAKAVRKRSKS